ncbi:hypothetical protein [Nocardia sp. NPDC047038]|uniref:hypothetical protein n=1 Tax=Nocardia sp. NPDC047038 TaxID=3154338 RepID=UPI0033D545C8
MSGTDRLEASMVPVPVPTEQLPMISARLGAAKPMLWVTRTDSNVVIAEPNPYYNASVPVGIPYETADTVCDALVSRSGAAAGS